MRSSVRTSIRIYVPTRGRVFEQLTLAALPQEYHAQCTVVCGKGEKKMLLEQFPKLGEVIEKQFDTLAIKRAWIFRHAYMNERSKIIMMDDDLQFAYRMYRKGEHRLNRMNTTDSIHHFDHMFKTIDKLLNKYRHGGIGPRYMNQNKPEYEVNTKATHALFFHVPTVMQYCKLGQAPLFHDLDYTLQLLRAGFENVVCHAYTCDEPKGFNAPGGLSLYRDAKKIDRALRVLAENHPGVVKLVKRKDKGGDTEYKGKLRPIIYWKKAAAEGAFLRSKLKTIR